MTRAALQYSLSKLGLAHRVQDVDELLKGLTTAMFSNGSPDMLKVAAESSGLAPWLNHIISVDATRHYKTSPVCYALAVQTLQAPTESLIFVSSNAWDALGATWYGFQTCWVNRQDLPPETLGLPAHHTCHSLDGLIDVARHRAQVD